MRYQYSVKPIQFQFTFNPTSPAYLEADQNREAVAAFVRLSKTNYNEFMRAETAGEQRQVRKWYEVLSTARRERNAYPTEYTHTLQRLDTRNSVELVTRNPFLKPRERRDLLDRLRSRLRTNRAARRQVRITNSVITVASHRIDRPLIGGVHQSAGFYLGLVKTVKKRTAKQSKVPKSAVKHIGIEIEFASSLDDNEIVDAIIQAGLEKYVCLKGDGSVHGDQNDCECDRCSCCGDVHDCECETSSDYGHEICILAPQHKFAGIVKRVCAMLSECGAYVNKTCGLHVHLDVRNRDKADAFSNLVNSYQLLAIMVPNQRRDNNYCLPPRYQHSGSDKYDTSIERYAGSRYWAINPAAIRDHNTIEVRLHSGTTNATKIINWVRILVRIVEGKQLAEPVNTVAKLKRKIKLPKRLEAWAKARIEKFQGHVNSDLNENAA